jgi:hypothetical protein
LFKLINISLIQQGDVSNKYTGYVAVDNVKLLSGYCPVAQFCDFESPDICGYENDPSGDFTWTRNRRGTSSLETGPSYDHVN